MLGPSAIPLSIQMGRDWRLVGPGGVPLPDAIEAVYRMVFVGGWKAQGLDDHAQVAWVEQAQDLLQAHRAMVVGRKMDNERSVLRSNKEFSSQLQETNDFEIAQLLRLIPGPAVRVLFLPPLSSPSAGG